MCNKVALKGKRLRRWHELVWMYILTNPVSGFSLSVIYGRYVLRSELTEQKLLQIL